MQWEANTSVANVAECVTQEVEYTNCSEPSNTARTLTFPGRAAECAIQGLLPGCRYQVSHIEDLSQACDFSTSQNVPVGLSSLHTTALSASEPPCQSQLELIAQLECAGVQLRQWRDWILDCGPACGLP